MQLRHKVGQHIKGLRTGLDVGLTTEFHDLMNRDGVTFSVRIRLDGTELLIEPAFKSAE